MNKQRILKEVYKMRQKGENRRILGTEELLEALETSGKSLRAYFESEGAWIFGTIIFPRHKDAFFYLIDTLKTKYINETSFCGFDDELYLDKITDFINSYASQVVIDKDICDVFEGNLTPEEQKALSKVWYSAGYTKELITYELDHDNRSLANLMQDVIDEKNQNVYVTEDFMLGIFQSHNVELHHALQQLMLSSRYGDSYWSAICDHAFAGTNESLESLLELILQHNLLRHSSIRRAVGVHLGLAEFNTHDLEHTSKALLSDVLLGLQSKPKRTAMLKSTIPMDIYIGLWCTAHHSLDDLEKTMCELLETNNRIAALTIGYFLTRKDCFSFAAPIAVSAIQRWHEDKEVLSQYLKLLSMDMQELIFINISDGFAFYAFLMKLHDDMPAKGYVFPNSTFAWHNLKAKRGDIVRILFRFIGQLEDTHLLDQVCTLIPEIDADYRFGYYRFWLRDPQTDIQRRVIIEAVGSRQEYCRKIALHIVENLVLNKQEYLILEDILRRKDEEARRNAIRLLMKQDDADLYDTISRLFNDKKEEKRIAAMDMIKQLQKDKKRKNLYEQCKLLLDKKTDAAQSVSGKERIIKKGIVKRHRQALYTKTDIYHPDIEVNPNHITLFQTYFPSSGLPGDLLNQTDSTRKTVGNEVLHAKLDLRELEQLIGKHEHERYTGFWGETWYVGSEQHAFLDEDNEVPLKSIWRNWFEAEIKDPQRLVRSFILLCAPETNRRNIDIRKSIQHIFGKGYEEEQTYLYPCQMCSILGYLITQYVDSWELSCLAQVLGLWMIKCEPSSILRDSDDYCCDLEQIENVLSWLKYRNHHEFLEVFPIATVLSSKLPEDFEPVVCVNDFLFAVIYGVISEESVYAYILDKRNFRKNLCDLTCLRYEREVKRGRPASVKNRQDAIMSYHRLLKKVYHNIIKEIFAVELHRGDLSTVYSHALHKIGEIRGVEYFVQLLTAIGDRPLDRSGYVSDEGDYTRTAALCVLLKATRPSKYDSVDVFRKALKDTDIKDKRLIEAALYAPDWMDLIGEYLGIPGFVSACCFFLAHMRHEDMSERLEAKLSRFTPLDLDELHEGAFDLEWFKSVQYELDEKTFKEIYLAAKYIADGSSHTRARKYADAALGAMNLYETELLLLEKRNKDLLMAYPLIPIKDEADMIHRYQFLQDFLKESRKFGAKRRESERQAVARAVKNLAVSTGYDDEMRMILNIEQAMMEDPDLSEKEKLRLMKQQKIRAKNMFEQAMIDETLFTMAELNDYISYPVIGELIKGLVWRWEESHRYNFGFYDELELNPRDSVWVAHPIQLYEEGRLDSFRDKLNQTGVTQPFKQLNREVFVTTDNLSEQRTISCFSGTRVLGRRAKRILSGYRWIPDGYDGMEKVFYKHNIVATLTVFNDWIDEDFPILDRIEFHTRHDFSSLKIEKVPEIVYSEVMREIQNMINLSFFNG